METNNKFTPGPWKVAYIKRGHMGDKIEDMKLFHTIEACHQPKGVNGRSLIIAEMHVGDSAFGFGDNAIEHTVSDEEAQANARLIAAAPELLEALMDANRWIETLPEDIVGGSIMPMKLAAVIEKATS